MPWHSHRDRMAEIATTLGLLTGTLGKIARDISLHTQTEIGELREPAQAGRGTPQPCRTNIIPLQPRRFSPPQSRVPGLVSTMLSAMVQEDERGLGGWHAEWETLPEIVILTAGATHQLASVVPHLEIDVDRMRENLEFSKGLIFAEAITAALGEKIGRSQARELIDEASQHAIQTNRHLREIMASDEQIKKHFSPAELDSLFDARNYFGTASRFIDQVLENDKSTRKDKQA